MRMSAEINELAAALAQAQGELKNAPTDRRNPAFKADGRAAPVCQPGERARQRAARAV